MKSRFLPALMAIALVFTQTSALNAIPLRETTDQSASTALVNVGSSPAEMQPSGTLYLPPQNIAAPELFLKSRPFQADTWVENDRLFLDTRLAAGQRLEFILNPTTAAITAVDPTPELLALCEQAVARAPQWLRKDLRTNLYNITGEWAEFFQEMAAEEIINAEDHLVDEVAFCAAHISSGDLGSGAFPFELFLENATGIYEADEYLDYVRIIDHGAPGDDDYWSTVAYKVKDGAEGDTTEFVLDPYYYYWYIVHPRLSDEAPRFINPATGSAQVPPNGVFWRDFLLNHPDEGHPSLRGAMEGVGVLWSKLRNNGSLDNGAIGAVTTWIRTVLTFDSRNERPNQPVRIYRLHMGRCGEHEDMTAAAARAALIPTTGTACWPNDHVWNEFYDGEVWRDWEPVNGMMADSLCYERWSGGAWRAPALMRWRGDGFVETVTGQYHSNPASLTVTVLDHDRMPVDGAKVMLASEYLGGGLSIATWGFTSSDGTVDFVVGENRNIYMRIDSEIGSLPPTAGQVMQIITQSEGGRHYTWSQTRLNGTVLQLLSQDAEEIENPTHNCRVQFEFDLQGETVRNTALAGVDFLANIYPARLDLFLCDEENYHLYRSGESFDAFEHAEITGNGMVDFTLPTNGVWHGVFSNEQNADNYEDFAVSIIWLVDSEWNIPSEQPAAPTTLALQPVYPNPFNARTRLEFTIPAEGWVDLSVFDAQGRCLDRLYSGRLEAGSYYLSFNAENLESGIYFLRLESQRQSSTRIMTLVK